MVRGTIAVRILFSTGSLGDFMDVDQAARAILTELRAKVEAGEDGAIYGDRIRALGDIDTLLADPLMDRVRFLLLPTANLQELAIENGWGRESWPRLSGQNFHGDKWSPALVALSTEASAEGPFRP
jgi:hypothetical protein